MFIFLVVLTRSMVMYEIEGALSVGAQGLSSNLWEASEFYLLLLVKNGSYSYCTQNTKGISETTL